MNILTDLSTSTGQHPAWCEPSSCAALTPSADAHPRTAHLAGFSSDGDGGVYLVQIVTHTPAGPLSQPVRGRW